MLSRYLLSPLVTAAVILLYLAWDYDDPQYGTYAAILLIVAVIIYFSSPQIDWWWWKQRPPDLEPRLRAFIEEHSSFYQGLSGDDQREFRKRVFLFSQNKSWKPQNWKKVPEDVKAIIAVGAVTVHFGEEDAYLTDHLENIVVYPGSFPSPSFPEDWHSSETFLPDQVMLFSAKHLGMGFTDPKQYLDLAIYEFAKNRLDQQPATLGLPSGEEGWQEVATISNFQQEAIEKFIGLPEVELEAILATLFFTHPRQFLKVLPKEFQLLKSYFG